MQWDVLPKDRIVPLCIGGSYLPCTCCIMCFVCASSTNDSISEYQDHEAVLDDFGNGIRHDPSTSTFRFLRKRLSLHFYLFASFARHSLDWLHL